MSLGYNNLIWTCAGINPGYPSLYTSGQNYLFAVKTQANQSACANYCGGWYNSGMNAAVFYTNETCACWQYGDLNTSPAAAKSSSANATFIDFYETGGMYRPPQPLHWGVFTCPAGSYSLVSTYSTCYPLNFVPAQPALAKLGNVGGACPNICLKNYNTQFAVFDNWKNCSCYRDLAGLRVAYNYTSQYQVVDIYDFVSYSSSATSTRKSTTSTGKPTTVEAGGLFY